MLLDVLRNSLTISAFVLAMMLVVETINVATRGWVQERLARSGWRQLLAAAVLGALPGCLGAYTVVALYAHRAATLGALVAAMIATTGDEAFVLFAVVPRTALPLTLALLVLGFGAGWLTDRVAAGRPVGRFDPCDRLEVHEHAHESFRLADVPRHLRHPSFPRALLVGGLLLAVLAIVAGEFGHGEGAHLPWLEGLQIHDHGHGDEGWGWLRVTFLVLSLTALGIVIAAPDHFLEDHLWRHVTRRHLPALLAWTFGALLLLTWLIEAVNPARWLGTAPWLVGLSAALIGVIPLSGPHLLYVGAFAKGLAPLSALVISSIVQDGHGMLPLLAQSRRAFVLVKGINLLVGLLVGALLLLLGR